MKLIKKSKITDTTIAVQREASLMNRALTKLIPGAERELPQQYIGKRTFGTCFVQFDFMLPGGDYPVSTQRYDVVFGTELYQGLRAVRHHGSRVYECVVDSVSEVKIGTINLVE